MKDAVSYNQKRFFTLFTVDDITALVAHYQAHRSLIVDGKFGPITAADLRGTDQSMVDNRRAWPLPRLADGRKPVVTSGHASVNADRKNHFGADIMYARRDDDSPMVIGDGGRTAKWWVPSGTLALAASSGRVVRADLLATGFRVWVDHLNGGRADSLFTGYFHLSSLLVAVGDDVTIGQALGTVGDNPADSDPVHLHFEVYQGALADYPSGTIDPAAWLEFAETM